MSSDQLDDESVAKNLQQQLSHTRYACSSLSPPLSTRPGNVVFRGILANQFQKKGGVAAESIIIKHSTGPIPRIFEELLLQSLEDHLLSSTVKVPRLYSYDRQTNTQILEDFSETFAFRTLFTSVDHDQLHRIGLNIGRWLRSFHTWASALEQEVLRAQMWLNDQMRKTKYQFTYGGAFRVLEAKPHLIEGHETTLDAIKEFVQKDFERPSAAKDDGYGLIHGDFWSGKYASPKTALLLIVERPLTSSSILTNSAHDLFIIDWEFAQFGHRSCDLGQIIGDLYERKLYNNVDTSILIMEGFIQGYGALTDDMAFRTAIYVGGHLISWNNRRPKSGPRVPRLEVIEAGLTLGREFMVKGWERDRDFFRGSVLASLFDGD